MDDRVKRLKSVDDCARFAKNATERDRPDLAREARQRSVTLRAESHEAESQAEVEALEAVYAYEDVLTKKNGRRTRATRTWQMIRAHGVLEAVERAVSRSQLTAGYDSLVEMGLEDFAFEVLVVKYPEHFSSEAVELSKERIAEWKND